MDKILLGELCLPASKNIKLASNDLIDYVDISSVDNQAKSITGYTTYEFQNAPSRARKSVSIGDVIISTVRPNLNAVAVFDITTPNTPVVSTGFCVLSCRDDVNPRYVYYVCQSKEFIRQLVSQATGASYPAVNDKIIRNALIPYHALTAQNNICNQLDSIQSLINIKKKENDIFNEIIKARFVEMFGTYPVNERGWDTGTIRDLVTEVRYGSSRKAADGDSGKYPYLRMNNITYNGELDLTDTKTIDIPDEELDKCAVRRGDLLFNRTNSKELVGKTCIYNRDEIMVLAGFVVRVRLNDRALPEFVSAFMNTDFSKQMLLGMCKAAIGQANINAQELQNIGIYIPPIQMQKDFVSFKAQVDKSKAVNDLIIDRLQKTKASLMQEYFG